MIEMVIWTFRSHIDDKKTSIVDIQYCVSKTSHIDGLVQDCSISSVLAMEMLQSYTYPSISTWCKPSGAKTGTFRKS